MINENEQNFTEQEEEITEVSEPTPEEESLPEEKQADAKQSWKELREKADRADKLQKERDEYYNMLKSIEEQYYQPKQVQQPKEETFDLDSIDDDDIPDGKTLKKIFKQQQRERLEMQEYAKKQQQIQYEYAVKNELTNRYNDFDDVVNESNIVRLREMRPGLARQLHNNPDIKEKAIETYYAIKELGIYETPNEKLEREKIQLNAKKPRSINMVADRGSDPLNYASNFSELTPELKKKLYEDALKKSGRN